MKYHAPVLNLIEAEVRDLMACVCLCTLASGAGSGGTLT